MTQDVTGIDFFCGAGGTTTGARRAGIRMLAAANHWPRAIETHNTNHPDVDHYLGDISDADMAAFPRADILFASPECRTHSQAAGRKPERTLFDDSPPGLAEMERSRTTMWDVVRYADRHAPAIAIVENVVEVMRWNDATGSWDGWLKAMHALDYLHRAVFLNSMVAWPTPQSRDRIYVVFWKRTNRAPELDIYPQCWCAKCEAVVGGIQSWKNPARPFGKYRTQYVYRCPACASVAWPYAYPAATAIDWSLPAPRIGDRARPLATKTMARIQAGLERYGPAAIVAAAGNTWERPGGLRAWPIGAPIPTQATTAQHALVVDTAYRGGGHVRSSDEPFGAQTARQSQALVVAMGSESGVAVPAAQNPLRTVVATCSTHALIVPLRTHGKAVPAASSVVPTVVAGNAGHALLVPAGGTWNDEARPVDEPMRARTTRDAEALVVPPAFVMRNNGGGAEMSTGLDEPLRTMTSRGHQSLVTMPPFLVPYYGTGVAHSVEEPMGAVTTLDRRALVQPAIAVEDCGFRMLEPHEIGAAMAFAPDYVVLGNKRERVRQYGNAVTPPASDILAGRAMASLA